MTLLFSPECSLLYISCNYFLINSRKILFRRSNSNCRWHWLPYIHSTIFRDHLHFSRSHSRFPCRNTTGRCPGAGLKAAGTADSAVLIWLPSRHPARHWCCCRGANLRSHAGNTIFRCGRKCRSARSSPRGSGRCWCSWLPPAAAFPARNFHNHSVRSRRFSASINIYR